MVILIIFMFVVATWQPSIVQTSFAIESSPLLLFGGRNMHASTQ